ncbi:hypothetical protein V2W45_1338054 [Cenococcum geophilum]
MSLIPPLIFHQKVATARSDNIETRFNTLKWGYEPNTAINILPESSDSEKARFNTL